MEIRHRLLSFRCVSPGQPPTTVRLKADLDLLHQDKIDLSALSAGGLNEKLISLLTGQGDEDTA